MHTAHNDKLRTICIEAVRHVIANMNIDDALKKKDDIAENLKQQLKAVEDKWGIVFDKVGIEAVRIMSNSLFEDLQSQFRDGLRLEVSRTRINTDRQIAQEENTNREKTELETIETEQRIDLSRLEKNTRVKESELEDQKKITTRERDIREHDYRRETEFNLEKQGRDHELSMLAKDLELKRQDSDQRLLKTQREMEAVKNEMARARLEVQRLEREIEQLHTGESLTNRLIETLPEIFQAVKIDNYSVLNASGDGGITPVGKFLNELLFLLKSGDLHSLLDKNKKEE